MITFSKLGAMGRLGNQLFQIAFMIGLSRKYQCDMILPQWKYAQYFKNPVTSKEPVTIKPTTSIKEKHFHFTPDHWDNYQRIFKSHVVDITAWGQSEQYWLHCVDEVKQSFEFTDEISSRIINRYIEVFKKPTIAISIRRGDYVNNVNYELLPIHYYLTALFNHFPDFRENYNLLIFSDDIPYCKIHFQCLKNAYFAENMDPIEQLALGASCQPEGTLVTTPTGKIPIEKLKPGMKVVSYSKEKHRLNTANTLRKDLTGLIGRGEALRGAPAGRNINSISSRLFCGKLVKIVTESNKKTRYTPDHHCIIKLGDAFKNKFVLYLMQKGTQFRVGVTSPRKYSVLRKRKYSVDYADIRKRFGPNKAEKCWVLATYDSREEVFLEEAFVSSKFGIPEAEFRYSRKNGVNHERLSDFWNRIGNNSKQAEKCLEFYNRNILYPFICLSERGNTKLPDTEQVIRACNMLDGMLVLDSDLYLKKGGKGIVSDAWTSIKVAHEYYSGLVYSMDIDVNHTYIGDDIVTHNCDHFIIANSTFSWWMAYLGQKEGSKVVRPNYLFAGPLLEKSDSKDFYPGNWHTHEHKIDKINLRDVTFTIPVFYDSNDRRENVELCVGQLLESFDTNIIIGEQGLHKRFEYLQSIVQYRHFHEMTHFHRTKMLNDMARDSKTPYVANWDGDIIVPPLQIVESLRMLKEEKKDMVYPYDGRFARVPRKEWVPVMKAHNDPGMFGNTFFKGMGSGPYSVGGAVMWNVDSFIEGGMENEYMISYAPEDSERYMRFQKLGFKIERVKGILYHIDHVITQNSSIQHAFYRSNVQEYDKERKMSEEELRQYVSVWPWSQRYRPVFYESIHEESVKSRDEVFKVLFQMGILNKGMSVVDAGCGLGSWGFEIEKFELNYVGIDFGVPEDKLVIPKDKYLDRDLKIPFGGYDKGNYDFALCLETLEHIEEEYADILIDNLCNLSDTILFSAAIPHQGGTNHVNEQWQSYWAKKFRERGYYPYWVEIREALWNNKDVGVWYRQNIVLYIRRPYEVENYKQLYHFDCVHPEMYLNLMKHYGK